MRVLVSNDDGYYAKGIQCLIDCLSTCCDVYVVAPKSNKSACSSALSVHSDLVPIKVKENHYILDGTSSDCVHIALQGLFDCSFDLVVSGINNGANLGDDVVYSGTVAAAIEGRFLDLPSIAISLTNIDCQYFDTAATIALQLIQRIKYSGLAKNSILNVNVPDLPINKIAGFKATRLGTRYSSSPIVEHDNKKGVYRLGCNGLECDNSKGTDFDAIKQGFISITPLQIDMTRHQEIDTLANWFESFE